jgi:hypothetical protein
VELASRTAISESTGTTAIPLPKNHSLDLQVSWPPRTVLHVQAAETKLELDHVELVRRPRFKNSTDSQPGDFTSQDVVLASVTSPIELDLDSVEKEPLPGASQIYYARSPGRAWSRVQVDFLVGGDPTLLLEPAAELEVTLNGIDTPKGARLRVRKDWSSGSTEAEFLINDTRRLVVDSLTPGVRTISVETGNSDLGERIELTSMEEIELVAGKRTSLSLELRPPPAPTKVALEGVVVIPEEWGISSFQLGAQLVTPNRGPERYVSLKSEQMRRQPGIPGTWAFSFPAVRPGLIELRIHPPDWAVTLQLGYQGRRDARVEVPRPGHVVLRLVDRDSGEDALIDEIALEVEQYRDEHSISARRLKSQTSHGRFEFVAPSGYLGLSTRDDGYGYIREQIAIEPGPNEITLEVARPCGFYLHVREGGATKSFRAVDVEARRVDGAGAWTHSEDYLVGKRFTVPGPGRYRLAIDDFDGCLSVPPREIQVQPGQFVEVAIDLQRKP